MGYLSPLPFSGNASLAITEVTPKSNPEHSPRLQPSSAHPNHSWPPLEIVRHVVTTHHASLRIALADLSGRLPMQTEGADLQGSPWGIILQQFARLHDALLSGIYCEESDLFPRFLHWQQTGNLLSPPKDLLSAAKTVERSHTVCLQMLWRLLRQTRHELPVGLRNREHQQFLDQLAALDSDYEQHLFEVECLLLPIIRHEARMT